jgi:hypothetical protein
MSDVMVITGVAFMDRVRSRVRSLPRRSLESILPDLDRTDDVEDLGLIFNADRQHEFLRRYEAADLPQGLSFDTSLVSRLPIWSGRFIALHLETVGEARSSAVLEIAERFAAALAHEIGLISDTDLLVDCVSGSIIFKIDVDATKIWAPCLATIAAALITAHATLSAAGNKPEALHPVVNSETICFVKYLAGEMEDEPINSITIYTSKGEAFTCEKSVVINSAKSLPEPEYQTRSASPRRINLSYERQDGTIEISGFFDSTDTAKFVVGGPHDAVIRFGAVLTEMPPERAEVPTPDTPYRISGHWDGTMRRGRFLVVDSVERAQDFQDADRIIKKYHEDRLESKRLESPE